MEVRCWVSTYKGYKGQISSSDLFSWGLIQQKIMSELVSGMFTKCCGIEADRVLIIAF